MDREDTATVESIRLDLETVDIQDQDKKESSPLPTLETQAKFLKGNTAVDVGKLKNHECETTPLLSPAVYATTPRNTFRQYGLLGYEVEPPAETDSGAAASSSSSQPSSDDGRIFLNVAAPWSGFVCGSQGSGKSHTLSCILENCLVSNSDLGRLEKPLTGIVFHYDRFSSYGSNQICEAAYLCSSGIPVKVLVSPTNYHAMSEAYTNLAGLPEDCTKPTVLPMQFTDSHLNIDRMMKMMAVKESDGSVPLYIEVIQRILREMAKSGGGLRSFDYAQFRRLLADEPLQPSQKAMMKMRLDLLESFLHPSATARTYRKRAESQDDATWKFEPGTLTIVDLSCPFVDAGSACALFNICLGIFLERRKPDLGRIVALDEAHKFLTQSDAAADFVDELLGVIRQQRHLGTRIVIATQEPTLSHSLLDLSNFTLVHRFTSPAWFAALRGHLAGIEGDGKGNKDNRLFDDIVGLATGEALLFCPSAMLRTETVDGVEHMPMKLGGTPLRVRMRARLTVDGGKSIMAG